ncbi:hypothetical protein HHK36_009787 [Tetracentron sinense]|uniref:Formin-like protein n=1 Tax=Tetracentron sinense TaxID=13715 RepID=A0A834ZDB0_TETSI|nr:hypothetical protein HHK36_009787 [Tetracentron sinense]
MKAPPCNLLLALSLTLSFIIADPPKGVSGIQFESTDSHRRILHQPLFPVGSSPPPAAEPPPESPNFPDPNQPFFPEVPTGPTPDQTQTTPPPPNASIPIPTATQPASPTKKVAIAISVGIVTLGMLSALAFFLYKHKSKHSDESQKPVGGNSQSFQQESTGPASSFLYLGTMEPSNRRINNEANGANGSPYRKLNSVHTSEMHRPSPELQPLPPLSRAPRRNSPLAVSSDDESQETFYTPQGSSAAGNGESPYPQIQHQAFPAITNPVTTAKGVTPTNSFSPHSRRTSPKSRLSISSPDMKQAIIPSPITPTLPLPPPLPPLLQPRIQYSQPRTPSPPKQRASFSSPPSPPANLVIPQSINNPKSRQMSKIPVPPPPPPPPPPLATPGKVRPPETIVSPMPVQLLPRPQSQIPKLKATSWGQMPVPAAEVNEGGSSSERLNEKDMDGVKPKLKPLHWDKVRATSDRATVWDQLKSSSFQLNEDMIETLFVCNSTTPVQKEATRKSVLPHFEQENRVLDPKKSQNIAILLRALNVTRDEVTEALLSGNPEGLGAELLETLVKMAPTKEEELKLRDYSGDISKLGSAERFLKAILDIPFAFKRVDAMLYRANFDTEVKYLRKSFETLEAASEELKNSRLFLKLLEAVLRTGNRMNVGTNRGDAKSFKLDTLLKLVDVKGTDGKTTLLHFVVQEIIRSEGAGSDPIDENLHNKMHSKVEDGFKKQGLQVVAGLSRELSNVKKAAGMDLDVLRSYVSKLEMGLEKVRSVLQYEKSNNQEKFFDAVKLFLTEAEKEILSMKADERKALSLVKEVTQYFHGDTAKEEAHPFRIFMIVRDFLSVLDQVCKEVGKMQERTMVGAARSFRISASASLPVLNRFNSRKDKSSDEDSSSSP